MRISSASFYLTISIAEALNGAAADLTGNVTVADIYSFTDSLLGPWDQRPQFKTHVSHLTSLRQCAARIESRMLRQITRYFPQPDYELALDKRYERSFEPKSPEHEEIFSHLQRFRAGGLVEPVGTPHLYYAAVEGKGCRLTALGKFYWKMVDSGRI